MSGAGPKKTPFRRLADALGLVLVFGILYAAVAIAPHVHGQASLLGALGFLILAGTLMSELIEVLGVPHLTGYLVTGIVAGPFVLKLVDHESVGRLGAVNTLAIALIALGGGAELRIDSLKKGFRTLVTTTMLQTFVGMVMMAGVFFLLRPAFVKDMPSVGVAGVALLWGVLTLTRSPSALLGVLSQTRAQGPLARYSLQFILTSDVVVVVVLAAAITIARPLIDPSSSISADAFRTLGHEVLGSVALGTTLGLVLAAYLKASGGRQLLVVLIALGFGATEVLNYLHYEPLLTFLVAGFVVQNFSKQGDMLIHAVEETGGVVYVVFFANAGAHLDVPLLQKYWPIALSLTVARVGTAWILNRAASVISKDAPAIKTWGWAPLISQAGIALGIAAVVARTFPTFGPDFEAIAIACVALNEMVGPVVFKFAIDRVKESQAPAPSLVDSDDAAPAA